MSLYPSQGVYCEIYLRLRGNTEEVDFSISLLRMIQCAIFDFAPLLFVVLYCTILYRAILYSSLLYSILLYYTALHCTVLYCSVLCCTKLLEVVVQTRSQSCLPIAGIVSESLPCNYFSSTNLLCYIPKKFYNEIKHEGQYEEQSMKSLYGATSTPFQNQ